MPIAMILRKSTVEVFGEIDTDLSYFKFKSKYSNVLLSLIFIFISFTHVSYINDILPFRWNHCDFLKMCNNVFCYD